MAAAFLRNGLTKKRRHGILKLDSVWGGLMGKYFGYATSKTASIKQQAINKGRTYAKQLAIAFQKEVLDSSLGTTLQNFMTDFASWFSRKSIEQFWDNIVQTVEDCK